MTLGETARADKPVNQSVVWTCGVRNAREHVSVHHGAYIYRHCWGNPRKTSRRTGIITSHPATIASCGRGTTDVKKAKHRDKLYPQVWRHYVADDMLLFLFSAGLNKLQPIDRAMREKPSCSGYLAMPPVLSQLLVVHPVAGWALGDAFIPARVSFGHRVTSISY